ncbi:hypothetical protein QSV08_12330 [Maribacter sp. BPC-D8]|uniref:hypothetical protein n=1 Tax=Maribacter sp. BPC-D8 TaxID=3053613 RepID=UPI002B478F58|nr:hypothetical protein [Maribacter sp. BPC-D8]WRI28011.1 hypothetical protein QSV08_12330 [Maribacter sp. BPC-D8]
MKKLNILVVFFIFLGAVSCRDTEKEQEQLDATLDKIEAVEEDLKETSKEVESKAKEVESALSELDSI